MKFRKKPVIVEAVQWNGNNLDELRAFVPEEFRHNKIHQPMGIVTLEGVMTVSDGDTAFQRLYRMTSALTILSRLERGC